MNIEDQGTPIDNPYNRTFSDDEISSFVNMIHSMHKCVQSEGVSKIRGTLFGNYSSVVPRLIDAGVVPKLLEFIAQENDTDLLDDSLSCIGAMSSEKSPFIEHFIELGGPDILFNHLDSSSHDVVQSVLWTSSNFAVSGVNGRDLCLKKDLVNRLIKILERFPTKIDLTDTVFWIIQNLTTGKPFPDWEKISPLLPILHKYIAESSSKDLVETALKSICDIASEKIQEVIDQGCVPALIKHLFGTERIAGIALRVLGNLLLGTPEQIIEILMFDEFLPKLFEFTQSSKPNQQKEAFWIISNLAAGGPIEIDLILKNDDYIAKIKNGVATASPEVAGEAGWTICNIFSKGNRNQVYWAIKHHKIMESFPAILMLPKPKLKHEALEIILMVLMTTRENWEHIYVKDIEEAILIEVIKDLAEEEEFGEQAKMILEFFLDPQIEEV